MAPTTFVPNCLSFQNVDKNLETSTQRGHRFIPHIPQEFDCRIAANIKPPVADVALKEEQFKTNYSDNYDRKANMPEPYGRPPQYTGVQYIRTVQEMMLIKPPTPIKFAVSEMKDSFRINYHSSDVNNVKAPCEEAKCHLVKVGAEQQPAIPIHRSGYWKWLDPYLTTYKSQYVPYDEVNEKISQKTLTFYNEAEFDLPPASGNKTMFDKSIFHEVLPVKLLSRAQPRVPYFGMQSEYQGHYTDQTHSYLYPHLLDRCSDFDDSLSGASRWQNLAPPGMYCSEYCNYGGHSVRRLVNQTTSKNEIRREQDCCRL